ncbi:MAG: deoxyguanosinetriphosphate triphosphohydrolase [Chloroflexi bacterium]|nr:MAG: deoxyguanosinetriphosphate triphosphohydrolase [Chloroflexota bacterium]
MLLNRERFEQIEAETLAPFALLSRASMGRRYSEPESQTRTAFQRDRDRILHSAAFRRLEYKTQVFVNDEGDYYRTRLTHTLEVAQIGRTLARAFGANEDLVEAICLAHDLGHPPFGHAGETTLNKLMEGRGGFNHNFQSFRVVTELEKRYVGWPGLNLTHETLEGIAKHETEYDSSDFPTFDDSTASLEAQIANVADELAYNAHDLDDGLQSGLFSPDELASLEIWVILCQRLGWTGGRLDEVTRHAFIRELIGLQVADVLSATAERLEKLAPQSPRDIQNHPENLVKHSENLLALNRALKDFLYQNMYRQFRVVRMAKRAERFTEEIFKAYLDEPEQLPDEYQLRLEQEDTHRVVADYIASMTDRSAVLEYRRLYDPLMRP